MKHNIDRTRSAPPDQGEPDLKEIKGVKLNVDAAAFSFQIKTLSASAQDFSPSFSAPTPTAPSSTAPSATTTSFSVSASTPSFNPNAARTSSSPFSSSLHIDVPDFVPGSIPSKSSVVEEVKFPQVKQAIVKPLPVKPTEVKPVTAKVAEAPPIVESVSDEDTDETISDICVDFELTKAKCIELERNLPTGREQLCFKYDMAFIKGIVGDIVDQPLLDRVKALRAHAAIDIRNSLDRIQRGPAQVFPPVDPAEFAVEWRTARSEEEKLIAEKAKAYTARRTATVEETEQIKKKIKITLNKLTPNNKDKLQATLLEIGKTCHEALRELAVALFDKAWSEQKYSSLYASICQFMKEHLEGFVYPDERPVDSPEMDKEPGRNWFKHELLTMCQEVFESRTNPTDFQGLSLEKLEAKRVLLKKKTIGNVRFIGELFKVNLISPRIVLNCINELLISQDSDALDEDKLEGACVLLTTGGMMFERSSLREHTDGCIGKMKQIIQLPNLPARFRFLLMVNFRQNVIDARKAGWEKTNVDTPRKVEEIRAEFVREQEGNYS